MCARSSASRSTLRGFVDVFLDVAIVNSLCLSKHSPEVHVERAPAALGVPVADVDRAYRRLHAGPKRAAENRRFRRDLGARLPNVAELEAHARERREQREVADAPVIARADPGC